MRYFIFNKISIVLLLLPIIYVIGFYERKTSLTPVGYNHEVMLSEQLRLMAEVFNTFGKKIDGTCDLSMKLELFSMVEQYPIVRGLTLLKNNQPFCSSHEDNGTRLNTQSPLEGISDNNVGVVLNYIRIDEVFTIQVEMRSLINQVSIKSYLLAFITLLDGKSEQFQHNINAIRVNERLGFFSQEMVIQVGGGSERKIFSIKLNIGLAMVLVSFCFFFVIYRGRDKILYAIEKHQLEQAVVNNELRPYIQPVVSSIDGNMIGGEILLRWLHPKKGIIYPAEFISFAERTGLIIGITKKLFVLAKNELLEIAPHLPVNFKVGFNISPKHLGDISLVQDCTDFINSFKLGSIVMVLEVTEQEAIIYSDIVYENIDRLHQAGIQLAIDDYGTGNSTLRNIQKTKFDYIKIDKSFIDLFLTDRVSMNILDNIIDLAAKVNAKTIAEGVETAEQANLLALSGVHFQQGWWWGKAMPIAEIISFARSQQ